MQKNQRNQQRRNVQLVTAVINGIEMKISPTSIGKSARKVLHGEFKQTEVNSPEMCKLGTKPSDSVLLWPEAGKPHVSVLSIAAAGVFATKFLESEGIAVTLK